MTKLTVMIQQERVWMGVIQQIIVDSDVTWLQALSKRQRL